MNKLQRDIHKWQMETFKSADQYSKFHHLKKEIVELEEKLSAKTPLEKHELAMEIADCCFLLYGIASLFNIDVIESIKVKFQVNKNRKWGKPDKNGVVEHVNE